MRVRHENLASLIECGMMQLAIEECQQLDKAESFLRRLVSVNKGTKKFLRVMINGEPDALIDHLAPY